MQSYEITPNKNAFFLYRFIVGIIFSFILLLVSSVFFLKTPIILTIIALCLLIANTARYFLLSIRFSKEKYIFLGNKIIRKSGSIFSDRQTELIIQNITHVELSQPYIENKLFMTGNIIIQSAGSSGIEILLYGIDKPQEIYDYVLSLMKHNGFMLTKSNLVAREKPHPIGVFFEVFRSFFAVIAFVMFILIDFIAEDNSSFDISKFVSGNFGIIIVIGLLFLLGLFIRSIFQYLDLQKRVYEIYNDAIVYGEGFLSRNYAIIPIENLADTTITQSLVDRIFGLYDVKISCQGAKQEILFKNLANGQKIEETIDSLIHEKKTWKASTQKKADNQIISEKKTAEEKPEKETASYDNLFTAEFTMDKARTLIPALFILLFFLIVIPALILIPLNLISGGIYVLAPTLLMIMIPLALSGVFQFIGSMIAANTTKYFVRQGSIEKHVDFLSTSKKQFTVEKITGVVFIESFIDKLFNTCSIDFVSIGSDESIKFLNIKKSKELYQNILGKAGIYLNEPVYRIESRFSLGEMLKANILVVFGILCLSAGLIIAGIFNKLYLIGILPIIIGFVIAVIYRTAYYRKSRLVFYKNCIFFKRGLFFEENYFALHDNIKDITITKYPFSDSGSIMFNVAGEKSLASQNKNNPFAVFMGQAQQAQTRIQSNNFTIRYSDGILSKNSLIDLILYHKPNAKQVDYIRQNIGKYKPKPILETKPALGNSLVINIPIFLFFYLIIVAPFLLSILGKILDSAAFLIIAAIFILLLCIEIILTVWIVKARNYCIEPHRITAKWGIIYKRQVSVLFRNIDHINFAQGMINKMFNNGNIVINTIGSSRPELVIRDISDYKGFYEMVEKRY